MFKLEFILDEAAQDETINQSDSSIERQFVDPHSHLDPLGGPNLVISVETPGSDLYERLWLSALLETAGW